MLDFVKISEVETKRDHIDVFPKFLVKKSKDLMIRGSDFYAIWDEKAGLWLDDEYEACRLIDEELNDYISNMEKRPGYIYSPKFMWDSDSGSIDRWHKYVQKQLGDSYHPLDEKLIFSNSEPNQRDYATHILPYSLEEGPCPAWEELVSTLYSPEERQKIEWAIGSIISGESTSIQKFIVMYGSAGTGKSTILNIIQKLFEGYYCVFDSRALGSASNAFALEAFKTNPLVAIQHDGDLSHIEDNTRLNSIVSHEEMTINEKFKSTYTSRINSFLFMGTNKPVKITDAKSGIIRRLIDVSPTGNKLPPAKYKKLIGQIDFELGAIASRCRDVYLNDKSAYDNYIPIAMIGETNDFYNFVMDNYYEFSNSEYVTLKRAWELYKIYCDEAKVPYPLSMRLVKAELKNYFKEFVEREQTKDGEWHRNVYRKFYVKSEATPPPIVSNDPLYSESSYFDKMAKDWPAQYATSDGIPKKKWSDVTTTLKDIDTSKLHFVKVPENHIVIDFDLKDRYGNKSLEKNLEAASRWPSTYAEFSKSGCGVHLHYIYDGDASRLSRVFDTDIEVKVYTGNSSLRRKLSKCWGPEQFSHIKSNLPLKEEKVLNSNVISDEKHLRILIKKNLFKEIHSSTRCSCDFIKKLLDDAYSSGIHYDVTDMRPSILAFAQNSTNQSLYCIKLVETMKFKSEEASDPISLDEAPIVFWDCEVYPNLFLVNWKVEGEGKPIQRMINPSPNDVEKLLKYRLVGFNCRRYDNHILYARLLGYSNLELYNLSQRIIGGSPNAMFQEAYNLSYTDVYDFASTKQSLKKWEIELGIHHQEMGLPWDQPVDEKLWPDVAAYCDNDVIATESVFNHLKGDFMARKILAEVAGMTPNDSTNQLTTRIIFGKEKHPALVYTDLSDTFPGYEYKNGCNIYRGEDVGRGGYVYANPGMYGRVVTFDVASMHPSSIIAMRCFGDYTDRFKEILDARLAIKHGEFEKARGMLGGALAHYIPDNPDKATVKALTQALKIAINSVYGLTSASFDNPFKDNRNVNNIVALRGALFMVNLRDELIKRGGTVVHIKTDSIKLNEPTQDLIDFVLEYGKKYGYNFEVEHIFERICLVNNAVYIAKLADDDPDDPGQWTATGAQFQHPYVFKTLFSGEEICLKDLTETKSVKTSLYLDFNEDLPEGEHDLRFVGKVGCFCPVKSGGGLLVKPSKTEGKWDAVTGSKGYRWVESESLSEETCKDEVDLRYFRELCDEAIETINQFGDFEAFTS